MWFTGETTVRATSDGFNVRVLVRSLPPRIIRWEKFSAEGPGSALLCHKETGVLDLNHALHVSCSVKKSSFRLAIKSWMTTTLSPAEQQFRYLKLKLAVLISRLARPRFYWTSPADSRRAAMNAARRATRCDENSVKHGRSQDRLLQGACRTAQSVPCWQLNEMCHAPILKQ